MGSVESTVTYISQDTIDKILSHHICCMIDQCEFTISRYLKTNSIQLSKNKKYFISNYYLIMNQTVY